MKKMMMMMLVSAALWQWWCGEGEGMSFSSCCLDDVVVLVEINV
jgi:hypothetical protein